MANPRYAGFKHTVGDASNPTTALVLDDTSMALHVCRAADTDTDWNVSADTNPTVYVHSDTTPATDYILIGRHTGTAADIDLVGAATLNLKIDGTAEVLMTASILDLTSTDLQMQSGGQILDDNGNELVEFSLTASAVNGIKIRNQASGSAPWITNEGGNDIGLILGNHDGTNWEEILVLAQTATAVNGIRIVNAATGNNPTITNEGEVDTGITLAGYDGTNTEEILILDAIATAVNEVTLVNAATGNAPTFSSTGGDTNIDLGVTCKGTGAVVVNNGTDPVMVKLMGAAGSYTNEITDLNGNEILALQGVTSAVNELAIKNAATTAAPTVEAQGGDTNIDIAITTKGTGVVQFATAGNWAANDTVTVTITALGPTGVSTSTINSWLAVKKDDASTVYIPCWT